MRKKETKVVDVQGLVTNESYDILSDVVKSGIELLPSGFFRDNNLVKGEDFICLGLTDKNPLPYYGYTYVYVLPKHNFYKVYIEN